MPTGRKSRPPALKSKVSKKLAQTDETRTRKGVSLEDFLVLCQKSLARSIRHAQQTGKSDSEFAQGERPVYMIEGLEMDVNAAFSKDSADRIMLDFNAPAEMRSNLKFRVQGKPVELVRGAKLELANLDPLGASSPTARMRAWLIDDDGRPVAGHAIFLHFVRAGEKQDKEPVLASTDAAGRVDFFVFPLKDELKLLGVRRRFKVYLRGSGRGLNPDEYFVWATAVRKSAWLDIASPTAPRPPRSVIEMTRTAVASVQAPAELCSELHRLRIE